MQSRNLSDEHRARGVTTAPSVKQIWDWGLGVGGPIRNDRLWFYQANRWWGAQEYQPGAYYNKTQHTLFYTPDLSRPGYTNRWDRDHKLRLTWQVASKNKVTFSHDVQDACYCQNGVSSIRAPESIANLKQGPSRLTQVTWSNPWALRPGPVDRAETDAEPGPSVRLLQRI